MTDPGVSLGADPGASVWACQFSKVADHRSAQLGSETLGPPSSPGQALSVLVRQVLLWLDRHPDEEGLSAAHRPPEVLVVEPRLPLLGDPAVSTALLWARGGFREALSRHEQWSSTHCLVFSDGELTSLAGELQPGRCVSSPLRPQGWAPGQRVQPDDCFLLPKTIPGGHAPLAQEETVGDAKLQAGAKSN